jgi:hypothetical protein
MATDVGSSPSGSRTVSPPPFPYVEWESDRLWSVVKDTGSEGNVRISALEELVARRDPGLAGFLLDELERVDLPSPWQERLIFAAEDVDFLEEGDRARLRERLYNLAKRLSDPTESSTGQEALWAAVRRFASLVAPGRECEQALRLLGFLRPGQSLLLQQVALQCVQNLFADRPPNHPEALRPLRRRAADLAVRFLDQDVVSSPANAALAINAIHALAVLGDRQLPKMIRQARGVGKGWLESQLRRRLEQVRDRWDKGKTADGVDRTAFARLEDAILQLHRPGEVPDQPSGIAAVVRSLLGLAARLTRP